MHQVPSTLSKPKQWGLYRHFVFLQLILPGLHIENSNESYSSSICTTDVLRAVFTIVMPLFGRPLGLCSWEIHQSWRLLTCGGHRTHTVQKAIHEYNYNGQYPSLFTTSVSKPKTMHRNLPKVSYNCAACRKMKIDSPFCRRKEHWNMICSCLPSGSYSLRVWGMNADCISKRRLGTIRWRHT
jgi:hypothetical protein